MNGKVSILAIGLLACSTQALPEPPTIVRAIQSTPATKPDDPAPGDGKGLPPAKICQLGTDCLTMDSRPFELCQVSARSCGDKLAEVLQVDRPKIVVKPAPPLRISR